VPKSATANTSVAERAHVATIVSVDAVVIVIQRWPFQCITEPAIAPSPQTSDGPVPVSESPEPV
jgi:hypothetical protein